MRTIAFCVLLGFAGCLGAQAAPPAKVDGWKTAQGKAPTTTEFAAVLAACEHKQAASGDDDKGLDACLGELGLKRVE